MAGHRLTRAADLNEPTFKGRLVSGEVIADEFLDQVLRSTSPPLASLSVLSRDALRRAPTSLPFPLGIPTLIAEFLWNALITGLKP